MTRPVPTRRASHIPKRGDLIRLDFGPSAGHPTICRSARGQKCLNPPVEQRLRGFFWPAWGRIGPIDRDYFGISTVSMT